MTTWLTPHGIKLPRLALCMSEREYLNAAKQCRVSSPIPWLDVRTQNGACHTWVNSSSMICLICLSPVMRSASGIDVASTLVHEAVHVFQSLCEDIGESSPSKEFEAYTVGAIAESLMREYARRIKS